LVDEGSGKEGTGQTRREVEEVGGLSVVTCECLPACLRAAFVGSVRVCEVGWGGGALTLTPIPGPPGSNGLLAMGPFFSLMMRNCGHWQLDFLARMTTFFSLALVCQLYHHISKCLQ